MSVQKALGKVFWTETYTLWHIETRKLRISKYDCTILKILRKSFLQIFTYQVTYVFIVLFIKQQRDTKKNTLVKIPVPTSLEQ